jgi:Na+-translocating ferredoxin:NAD+ oxidoreductase RnfG subunit
MNKNGVITKIKILTQNETPGLGTKILAISKKETDWQKILRKYGLLPLQQPDFQAQFVGKKVETLGARVAVITGATVTSKAVIESIQAKGQDIMNRVKNEK